MTATAREILKREYGSSKNFMTPHVIRIGKITGTIAFELSSGEFGGSAIWGVSFAEMMEDGGTSRRTDISESFGSRGKAEAYISEMKGSRL